MKLGYALDAKSAGVGKNVVGMYRGEPDSTAVRRHVMLSAP